MGCIFFRPLRLAAFLAVSALFAVAALLAAGAASTHPQAVALTTVKVGEGPTLNWLPHYVAIEKGFYAKRGIKIERITGLPAVTVALLTGEIDMGLTNVDAAIIAASQGRQMPVIAFLNGGTVRGLYVRKDLFTDAMKRPYPLNVRALPKGHTYGLLFRGGGPLVFMESVFGNAGLQEGRDYSAVVLNTGPNVLAALAAKRVDAAMLFPPFDQLAIRQGLAVPLVDIAKGQGPQELVDALGAGAHTNKEWLAKHPRVAKNFVAAVVDSMKWLQANAKSRKEEIIDIGVKYTGVTDRAAIAASFPTLLTKRVLNPSGTCAKLAVTMRPLLKGGLISNLPACGDVLALNILPKTNPVQWVRNR